MTKEKLNSIAFTCLWIFLAVQISAVNFSIAISSIGFGIWIVSWITYLSTGGKESLQKLTKVKYFTTFVGIYALAELLSRVFAVYPDGALEGLKRLLIFLIFYVTVSTLDEKRVKYILLAFTSSAAIISLYELIRYAIEAGTKIPVMGFSEVRIDYLNYPITAAQIKMFAFLLLLPQLFTKSEKLFSNKLLFSLLIPIALAMFLTQSRNVYLGVFFSLVLFGIVYNWKFLLGFIAICLVLWFVTPTSMHSRITSITDINHPSNKTRLIMWQTSWEIFKKNLITGVGDSKFRDVYSSYKTPETESEGVHSHNNILFILATTGIIGFIGFIGMFISLFFYYIRLFRKSTIEKDKLLIFGVILVLVSFHISGIFEWSFGDQETITPLFFILGIPFILNQFKENKTI